MPRDYGFPSSRERRGRMSKRARLLALVLSASLALAAYGTASAQAPPDIDASLTVEIDDSAPPTVGDPITFTLTVTHPPGYRVTFPRLYGTGRASRSGASPRSRTPTTWTAPGPRASP